MLARIINTAGSSSRQLRAASEAPDKSAAVEAVPLTAMLVGGFVTDYLMDGFDDPTPIPSFHLDWWEMCCSPDQYVAIAAPRDHAKSTAITHSFTLASVLFRQRNFVCIISSTYAIAVEFLRDIAQELSENDRLKTDFGVDRFLKDSEDNLVVRMKDGHRFRIVARGAEQKMRGLKWGNKRPDMMIFDDVEDDEQVENKERREKFAKWVMRAAIPAGKKNGCLYRLVGTVLHFDSFLENSLKAGSTWTSRRDRAHQSFDDFSNILWPTKYDESWFRTKRASFLARGDPDGYSQEYLNNPISEQVAYFKRANLVPFPEGFNPLAKGLRKYIGWDFAVSKQERSDWTAGVVVAVDDTGRKFIVDVFRDRVDTKGIIDMMLKAEKLWKPEFHAVEKGTIEKSIEPFLNDAMGKYQLYLNLYKVNSSKDKPTRAKSWQGAVSAHHVYFDHDAGWWPALQEEMVRFPRGENDDQIDAMSILGALLEQLGEGVSEAEQELEDMDEDYFIRTGAYHREVGRSGTTGY